MTHVLVCVLFFTHLLRTVPCFIMLSEPSFADRLPAQGLFINCGSQKVFRGENIIINYCTLLYNHFYFVLLGSKPRALCMLGEVFHWAHESFSFLPSTGSRCCLRILLHTPPHSSTKQGSELVLRINSHSSRQSHW